MLLLFFFFLHCCIGFCHTAVQIHRSYIYIPPPPRIPSHQVIPGHHTGLPGLHRNFSVALHFFCLIFPPNLLCRSWVFQSLDIRNRELLIGRKGMLEIWMGFFSCFEGFIKDSCYLRITQLEFDTSLSLFDSLP